VAASLEFNSPQCKSWGLFLSPNNAGYSILNPFAIQVMTEIGINILHHSPQAVNEYLTDNFYLVATVCDNAQKSCPVFTGNYEHIIHHGFPDPANATGSDYEIIEIYRQVLDAIHVWVTE